MLKLLADVAIDPIYEPNVNDNPNYLIAAIAAVAVIVIVATVTIAVLAKDKKDENKK